MKNTFTFQHEYGARNDPKIQDLLFQFEGSEGGAAAFAFWVTVEMLYEQGGYLPRNYYRQIAAASHCSAEAVTYLIEKSGLFKYDKTRIWSDKVLWQLKEREERSASASRSVAARWTRYKEQISNESNTGAIQSQYERITGVSESEYERNTISKDKESKVKENEDKNLSTNVDSSEISISEPPKEPMEEIFHSDVEAANSAENEALLTKNQCQQVLDFWNKKIADTKAQLSKVVSLSDDRRKRINIRWREFSEVGNPVEVTRELFDKVTRSKFLQGDNHNGWTANFDWIFQNSKNWLKVYEGNYDNKTPNAGSNKSGVTLNVNDVWNNNHNL